MLILQNKTPGEQSLFYLRQAIISESFDVLFMLSAMEQQLSLFDPQNIQDVPILVSMGHITRYVKRVNIVEMKALTMRLATGDRST